MFTLHPRELTIPHLVNTVLGARAAGTEMDLTLPLYTHWELISLHIQFIADANVANRYIRLEFGETGQEYFASICVPAMTAGVTYDIWWGRGMSFVSTVFANNMITIPLPVGLILQNPARIRTVTTNIQAGDVINAIHFRVYQWMDPVIV